MAVTLRAAVYILNGTPVNFHKTMSYLWLDAQQVFPLSGPELELYIGAWMISLEQHHTGVLLQDIPYLSGPLNYQSFYRV